MLEPLDGVRYAITYVSKDDTQMLWLEKLTGRTSEGKAEFFVIDAIELPHFSKSTRLLPLPTCSKGGRFDAEVFAAVRCEDGVIEANVDYLWRANRETGLLEALSPSDWNCECIQGDA